MRRVLRLLLIVSCVSWQAGGRDYFFEMPAHSKKAAVQKGNTNAKKKKQKTDEASLPDRSSNDQLCLALPCIETTGVNNHPQLALSCKPKAVRNHPKKAEKQLALPCI